MATYDIEAYGARGHSIDLIDTYTGSLDEAWARYDDATSQATEEALEAGLRFELVLREDGAPIYSRFIPEEGI